MPVAGAKPKPSGQIRHRVRPVHDWLEVPRRPFTSAPKLPPSPPRVKGSKPPLPSRPLGPHGQKVWADAWATGRADTFNDDEALQQLCELVDERVALRGRVLREGDPRERSQLRTIDAQVARGLARLSNTGIRAPRTWPARTRAWWAAVSVMPHCATWDDTDWSFAIDTAVIAAAFHAGDLRLAAELRHRERLMGTTADARRDLRIRYVDDDGAVVEAEQASVTAMDDYRKMVGS